MYLVNIEKYTYIFPYDLFLHTNKDKNVYRYALSAIRGELLESENEKERDSFGILYTGDLLSIVKIRRERERSKYHHKRQTQKV